MATISYFTGDATNPNIRPTIICHIVNTENAFGSGFVVPLAKKFPCVKTEYHNWYKNTYFPINKNGILDKLNGEQDVPFMLGEVQIIKVSEGLYVANMLAQKLGIFHGMKPIRYEAVKECLYRVVDVAKLLNINIISGPRFGSGLSGGDFNKILEIINETVIQNNLNMHIYDLPIT